MSDKKTVSIVQHGPEYLNKDKSTEKAIDLIKECSKHQSQLAVFGETWLSGYPAWLDYCPEAGLWNNEATKEIFHQTYQNAVTINGAEISQLKQVAREYKINVVMGINEVVESGVGNKTIYNSLIMISDAGELINHHRKLMPTFTEKIVYGHGDGNGLVSCKTSVGQLSGLICWEHWMPLTRQALHDCGEDVHVAVWPKVHEMHQVASRQYAFEARCFVLAAGQVLKRKDLPHELQLHDSVPNDPDYMILNGGSCIIGPDGLYRVDPVFNRETIIHTEIDLREVIMESMTLDVSGHYQRNDVFNFTVNRTRH